MTREQAGADRREGPVIPRAGGRWVRTGDTVGTSDDTRAVYRAQVDAETTILGDSGESRRMYTVFYRKR